jgi:phosphopantetheinyl transferase
VGVESLWCMKESEVKCKGNENWQRSGKQMVLVMETA